jgi:hypothetical protein
MGRTFKKRRQSKGKRRISLRKRPQALGLDYKRSKIIALEQCTQFKIDSPGMCKCLDSKGGVIDTFEYEPRIFSCQTSGLRLKNLIRTDHFADLIYKIDQLSGKHKDYENADVFAKAISSELKEKPISNLQLNDATKQFIIDYILDTNKDTDKYKGEVEDKNLNKLFKTLDKWSYKLSRGQKNKGEEFDFETTIDELREELKKMRPTSSSHSHSKRSNKSWSLNSSMSSDSKNYDASYYIKDETIVRYIDKQFKERREPFKEARMMEFIDRKKDPNIYCKFKEDRLLDFVVRCMGSRDFNYTKDDISKFKDAWKDTDPDYNDALCDYLKEDESTLKDYLKDKSSRMNDIS